MTLLQVINTIQKISSVQPNIHSFVGEFLALNDVTAKYSAIILQQRTHRRNNDFMIYSFYLGYADRLNEDKSNEVEVQSTAIQVIDDIVYKLENLNFDCTVGVYNTFTQRFLAEAAGGYVELDIVVPMGECEDDFAEEKLDTTITSNGEYNFIPKGLGFQSVHLNVDVAHLQDKSLDITKNGNYKVQYDKGFSGLNTVDVNVNIDTQSYYDNGYSQGKIDGKTEGIAEQKAKLTDIEIVENGVYERTDGYKKVEVNVPTSGGDGIDLTSLGYTAQENTKINTDIQDSITYSQSLLESYTDDTRYEYEYNMMFAPLFPCGNRNSFYRFFYQCVKLISIPTLNTSNGTNFNGMFYGCDSLTSVPALNTSNGTNFYSMFIYCSSLTSVPSLDTSKGTNFSFMFHGCNSLTSVPALDTSKGTNFDSMFSYCSSLTSVPALNTSNGTNFDSMFAYCNSLTSVPALNTSNGTNFGFMFRGCSSLTSVPALDTSKGTDFNNMFYGCYALTSVPALNTSNGTNFDSMFAYCNSLTSVPALNTSNGTNFDSMFRGCNSLTSVPALDTSKGIDFKNMFYGCQKLKTVESIDVSNGTMFFDTFNTMNLTDITFTGSINVNIFFTACKKLSFNSIKSILTACSKTTNTNAKTIGFDQSITDKNQELTNLVASCTSKGWAIQGLTITTA